MYPVILKDLPVYWSICVMLGLQAAILGHLDMDNERMAKQKVCSSWILMDFVEQRCSVWYTAQQP